MPDLSHLRNRDELLITMVCLGNICRSPMAAAVLANRTSDWTAPKILVDSAGTSNWHVGEGPNPPSKKTWEAAGYKFDHIASQMTASRMEKSDLILVMDRSNHRNVLALTEIQICTARCISCGTLITQSLATAKYQIHIHFLIQPSKKF